MSTMLLALLIELTGRETTLLFHLPLTIPFTPASF